MWLLAFSSATHDIAADGFYMLALDEKKQAYFVGIRNTFYRLAVIAGQGLLVMFAGVLEKRFSLRLDETQAISQSWTLTFYLLAFIFCLLFAYHHFVLPRPSKDRENTKATTPKQVIIAFAETFIGFFRKKHIISALTFIFFYRFAEAQLVKIASPFLLDKKIAGGLGLETWEVGMIYGTIGVIALTIGGIIGGIVMARNGLKHWFGG